MPKWIFQKTSGDQQGVGVVHKQCGQFFPDFWHPPPHVSSFLVLSVGNFDRFLTPPPSLNCRRHLWTAPNRISNFFLTTSSNLSNFTLHPYLYFLRNLTSSKIPHYYNLKLVNMCLIKKNILQITQKTEIRLICWNESTDFTQ